MSAFVRQPRWLAFHAICLIGVVVMVNLSFWQFNRRDDRQEFNELVRSRTNEAVIPIEDLDLTDPDAVIWRRVGAAGTYIPEEEVLILNRSQGGRAGVNIATPLILEDGQALIVIRGFVPLSAEIPAPPPGQVRVVGVIRASEERRTGQPTESAGDVNELFRLDLDRLAAQIDEPLLPVALALEISDPSENMTVQPVAKPELSDGPHLSYAVQWLIFAIAVFVGWFLAVRRSYVNYSRDSGRYREQPSDEIAPPHSDSHETDQASDTQSPH